MELENKFDGSWYLTEMTKELQKRIEQLDRGIEAGKKEIAGMHEYYWENYTEMDEYGYENFDNQQALLMETNANKEQVLLRKRLKKMMDSPFFGRVDFVYDGEEEPEVFYIGIGNFSKSTGGVPLIYDWRAPISALFYDYDKGRASYEAPIGRMEGEIHSKWQYKIKRGKMIYGFESDVKIDDDILKQELGSHGDVQLKNIVRTIQKEQNAIIRNTKDRILVIQGAAGSGKTSIALHRIAYLLYHSRGMLKSSNVLILSPNHVFSDYISHILPELGEENIKEMSFDLFAYQQLQDIVEDCEDKFDYVEKCLAGLEQSSKDRYYKKQSREFVGSIEGFLAQLEDRIVDFRTVTFRGMQLSEEQIIQLFYFKFQEIPLLSRMDAVMEYFTDAYETLHNKDLPEEDRIYLTGLFRKMYVTEDIYVIYGWLLEELGYPSLPEVPREKRILPYEDVYPLLYLKYRLRGNKVHREVKHLVIDEMQDYSYLQYKMIQELFSCKMTILGDWAQTLDEKRQDVLTFLPGLLGRDLARIQIRKSYRNTLEIAKYAEGLTQVKGLEFLERHGKPVTEEKVEDLGQFLDKVLENLDLSEAGYETAAVITMTDGEAYEIYEQLKDRHQECFYMHKDSDSFPKGLVITTFYLAKGLEFDQVFTVITREDSKMVRQAKYICATRALHELFVYQVQGDHYQIQAINRMS